MPLSRAVPVFVVVILAIIVIVFGDDILAFVQKETVTIVIESRYWEHARAVQYVETDMVQDCLKLPCKMVPKTSTKIRCTGTNTGSELPTVPPLISCTAQSDDRVIDKIEYFVVYHKQESSQSQTAKLKGDLWSKLAPELTVKVKMTKDEIISVP